MEIAGRVRGARSCSMMAFAFWVSCSCCCRVKRRTSAVLSSHPNLDIGNPALFPVEVYGNAWSVPPPGDCDCMLAGPDGYPSFHGALLFLISGKIIATSPRISKAGNRACRSVDAPAFSLRARRARLLWCWWVRFGREPKGRAPLKGGVGVSPTGGI